jgi:hypothetical protein
LPCGGFSERRVAANYGTAMRLQRIWRPGMSRIFHA